MYETFFDFTRSPFPASPQTPGFVPVGPVEEARRTLARCVSRNEGLGLVIGPIGTGKTLLCHLLADEFRDRFQVVVLTGAGLRTRRSLLQALLFELALPYRGMEEAELRLSLLEHLESDDAPSSGLLLLVDEADAMPLRLIEEIRVLASLVRDGQSRIRLVMAGSPALEEKLAHPKLASLNQRVTARCYVEPLGRNETLEYIRSRIIGAGGDPVQVFTADAFQAAYVATDGCPRLINQLCDHALLLAAVGQSRQIDAAGIDEAWADLQQLPMPSEDVPQVSGGACDGSVIEFGCLDEESNDAVDALAGDGEPDDVVEFGGLDPETTFDTIEQQMAGIDREPTFPPTDDVVEAVDRAVVRPEQPVAGDFQPNVGIEPEIELVFHEAPNPFEETFEQEEVVVDHYAELDADALKNRPRVSSHEGRQIAAMLAGVSRTGPHQAAVTQPASADDSQREPVRLPEAAGDATEQLAVTARAWVRTQSKRDASQLSEAMREAIDPASDPVLPE